MLIDKYGIQFKIKIMEVNKMTQYELKIWKMLLLTAMIVGSMNLLYGRPQTATTRITHPDGTQEYVPIFIPRVESEIVKVIQPDGKRIELIKRTYESGYSQYSMQPGFTAILDSLTGYWCYASLGDDGWLESTGYPLHLHNGDELGIKRTIRPSLDRIEEYKDKSTFTDPQSRALEALFLKMPNVAPVNEPIKPLVIYISLSDQNPLDYQDPDALFNGDDDSFNVRRYYRNVSNNALNLSFIFKPYHDSQDIKKAFFVKYKIKYT